MSVFINFSNEDVLRINLIGLKYNVDVVVQGIFYVSKNIVHAKTNTRSPKLRSLN